MQSLVKMFNIIILIKRQKNVMLLVSGSAGVVKALLKEQGGVKPSKKWHSIVFPRRALRILSLLVNVRR